MSPKFLNMHQGNVAYKVVVFRINKNRLSRAADPCIFSYVGHPIKNETFSIVQ